MPDLQTIAIILIVAAAIVGLVWKFTRKKKGHCPGCGDCGKEP